MATFAKYEGIDGESRDITHDKWIDVAAMDWAFHKPGGGVSGMSRRRGAVVVEDMTLTMDFDKSAPKLQQKCLTGEIIPKLMIEFNFTAGGAERTYLRYEFSNVMITSFQTSINRAEGTPVVVLGNNFEEFKVTYTEYDETGRPRGNIESEWIVEKGES